MKAPQTVAALFDIHGNQLALEAVLEDIVHEDVDVTLLGGDIAWGPQPAQVVDMVREIDGLVAIKGNADRELAERHGIVQGLDEQTTEITAWCADQLSEEQMTWLAELPFSRSFEIGSTPTLFCHASPRSDEEILTPATPDTRLQQAFAGTTEQLIVCGHTHMQFDRFSMNKRIVNAGSVGLAYEDTVAAYWALIGPDVQLRRSPYDTDEAVSSFRASGCPHVEEVFVDNLRTPPGRAATSEHFEKVAEARRS